MFYATPQFPVMTDSQMLQLAQFTLSLGQASGTYDICTASGDLLIDMANVYVATGALLVTSVAIRTNQSTPTDMMSAVEGALANLLSQRNMVLASATRPIYLASGQKLVMVLVGLTGSGSLKLNLRYYPVTAGARLA